MQLRGRSGEDSEREIEPNRSIHEPPPGEPQPGIEDPIPGEAPDEPVPPKQDPQPDRVPMKTLSLT
jgi:hypothetical protein